jgi:mRNA interferase HicA
LITNRKALIHYLTLNGAFLLREGSGHSIFQRGKFKTSIPRHKEIVDELARKICKDLDIPFLK